MSSLLRFFATGPDQPQLTDAATIDALYRRHRLRVMLAITLGYGLIYTCRLALGVVKKPLIDAGIFGPAELGLIGSALFYTYAIGKLTNGFLADHANMKRFLAARLPADRAVQLRRWASRPRCGLSTLLWGLNGWFQSFGAPGGVVAMTAWFSNRERGRCYGIWSTAHSIGEGLTFLVVGTLVAPARLAMGILGAGTDRHRHRRDGVLRCCRIGRTRSDCRRSTNGRTTTTRTTRPPATAACFARNSRS